MSEYSLIHLMSNFRSYDELDASPSQDAFSGLANGLRRLYCRAVDALPVNFIPAPTPGFDATRAAAREWVEDTFCPLPPSPDPDPTAFAPGCPVAYNVILQGQFFSGDTFVNNFTRERSASRVVRAGFQNLPNGYRLQIFNTDGVDVGITVTGTSLPADPNWRATSITITRLDGQPVNTACPVPPVIDPDDIFPPDITINIDGDTFPVNIENVTYELGGDTYFSPSFNTSLGGVNFDLGGVNFSPVFLPTIVPPSPVPPPPPEGLTPQEVADIVQTANDLQSQFLINELENDCPTIQQIANAVQTANDLQSNELLLNIDVRLERLADFVQCLVLGEGESADTVVLSANTAGGTFVLPAGTVAVFVSLIPPVQPGTRVQSGSGSAPNLFYWGWYSVGRAGSGGQRDELIYQNQVIPVLPRFDEVIINPTFGNRASVAAITVSNTCVLQ